MFISSRGGLAKGRISLSSLVGMRSKRQVDGFDEEITEVIQRRPIREKLSIYWVLWLFPVFEEKLVLFEGGGD